MIIMKPTMRSVLVVTASIALLSNGTYAASQFRGRVNLKEEKSKSDRSSRHLSTFGFCFEHEHGEFCFPDEQSIKKGSSTSFRSIHHVNDVKQYQDFIDGKMYSYSIQNTDLLAQELEQDESFSGTTSYPSSSKGSSEDKNNRKLSHAKSSISSLLQGLEGVKYKCKVENQVSPPVDLFDDELLELHGDGSTVLRISHWKIKVDPNGIPISITEIDDSEKKEPFAYISGVHSFVETIDGCDPETEGSDAPEVPEGSKDFLHRMLLAHNPSISEEVYFRTTEDNDREEGRHVDHRELVPDWALSLQSSISNTQWCGLGTDKYTTPCPNSAATFDYDADHACRRHDHSRYATYTWLGLPRLECYIDRDLIREGGHNWAISAVYGKFGAMGFAVGCYNYESYYCFKRWRWTKCGMDWTVHYGPTRYNDKNAQNTYGYDDKVKTCDGDLPGY